MNAVIGVVFVFLAIQLGFLSCEPKQAALKSRWLELALFVGGAAAGLLGFVYLYLHWCPEVLTLQFGAGEVFHLRMTHVGDGSRTVLRLLPAVLGVVVSLSPPVVGYILASRLPPMVEGEDAEKVQ